MMQRKSITLFPNQAAVSGQVSIQKLPLPPTPLVGREREVAEICALLQRTEVRLLTLIGVGGVGKTRLGLEVAGALWDVFADGVCFVPLAPLSDPERVVPVIAQTLGLGEIGDHSRLEHVQHYLARRQMALLLDNFEQVLDAAPHLADLLASCPHLRLLVASRAALRLSGEYEYPVQPLAVPDLAHLPEREALAKLATVALFLQPAIEWLLGKQELSGRWKNQYAYNGKTWVDIDQQGQLSKWVTFRACAVLKAVDG